MRIWFKFEIVIPSPELVFDFHCLLHESAWNRSAVTGRITETDDEEKAWDELALPYIIENLNSSMVLKVYRFAKDTNSYQLKASALRYLKKVDRFRVLLETPRLRAVLPTEDHFEEIFDLLISEDVFQKIVLFPNLVDIISNFSTSGFYLDEELATKYILKIPAEQILPKDSKCLDKFNHERLTGLKLKLKHSSIESMEEIFKKLNSKLGISQQ